MDMMIVDDDMLILDDLDTMLDWESLSLRIVCKCTNGREALEKFRYYKPQIIIADIAMPMMDGLEFSKTVLKEQPNTKIILLTSYQKFEYAKTAIDLGVTKFILKHELDEDKLNQVILEIKAAIYKEQSNAMMHHCKLLSEFMVSAEKKSPISSVVNTPSISTPFVWKENFAYPYEGIASYLICFYERPPIAVIGKKLKRERENLLGEPKVPEDQFLLLRQERDRSFYFYHEAAHGILKKNQVVRMFEELKQENKQLKLLVSKVIFSGDELQNSYAQMSYVIDRMDYRYDESLLFMDQISVNSGNSKSIDINQFVMLLFSKNYVLALEEIEKVSMEYKRTYDIQAIHTLSLVLTTVFPGEEYECLDAKEFFDTVTEILLRAEEESKANYSIKVTKAIEIIKTNYREDVSLEMVASELEMSVDYLGKLFKRETGKKFSDYTAEYKMKIAKQMLETGDYKIYEVSDYLGFGSRQYFSLVFRKVNGISPSDCFKVSSQSQL